MVIACELPQIVVVYVLFPCTFYIFFCLGRRVGEPRERVGDRKEIQINTPKENIWLDFIFVFHLSFFIILDFTSFLAAFCVVSRIYFILCFQAVCIFSSNKAAIILSNMKYCFHHFMLKPK